MRFIRTAHFWSLLTLLGVAWSPVVAAPQQPEQADLSKFRIEAPPKAVLAQRAVQPDISKSGIEVPTKGLLAGGTSSEFQNPKVRPGKVRWHGNFDVACEAAKKSGKPVLLFHLMGNLDDQFC